MQTLLGEAEERVASQMRSKPEKFIINQVIKGVCAEAGVTPEEIRGGSQRRAVSEVRSKLAYRLNREMEISMVEITHLLGIGDSAIAMAIRKEENKK